MSPARSRRLIGLGGVLAGLLGIVITLGAVMPASADDSPSGAASSSPSDSESSTLPEPSPLQAPGLDGLSEIHGGSDSESAPELSPGTYLDTAPNPDTLRGYKVTRQTPGSTFQFGVTTPGVYARGQLDVRMLTPNPADPDGQMLTCGSPAKVDPVERTQMPLGTWSGFTSSTKKACVAAKEFFLVVFNGTRRAGDSADQRPVVAPGAPLVILLRELPVRTSPAGKTVFADFFPYLAASDPTAQVVPGDSMFTAPTLESDVVTRAEVTAGEPAWFAVDVISLQQLNVVAQVSDGAPVAGAAAEVRIVGPTGGFVDTHDFFQDESKLPGRSQVTLLGGSNVLAAMLNPLAESSAPTHEGGADPRLVPGTYFVVVFIQRLSGSGVATVPVTLNADVATKQAEPNVTIPHAAYDGDFTDLFTPTGSAPTDYTAPALSDREQSSGRSILDWLLIAGLVLLSIACAVVGVLSLRRTGGSGSPGQPDVAEGRGGGAG